MRLIEHLKKMLFPKGKRKFRKGKELVFCAKPFEFLHITRNQTYFCCPAWVKGLGSLRKNSLDEVWNSENAKNFRMSVLEGTYDYCKYDFCPLLQSDSLPKISEIEDSVIVDMIKNKQVEIPVIKKIYIGIDETCNLKCPTCRDNYIHLNEEEIEASFKIARSLLESKELLKNLEMLTFGSGGETFCSEPCMYLLKNMMSSDLPNLKIHITTNGLLLTPRLYEDLKNIRDRIYSIAFSIDAANAQTYRKVRGADFEKLKNNLNFVKDLKKQGKIAELMFFFVVQKENFREMEDFVQFANDFSADSVLFNKMNQGRRDDLFYQENAVHQPQHPDYQELVQIIKKPVFRSSKVNIKQFYQIMRDEKVF